jgi:hypothetical protein
MYFIPLLRKPFPDIMSPLDDPLEGQENEAAVVLTKILVFQFREYLG